LRRSLYANEIRAERVHGRVIEVGRMKDRKWRGELKDRHVSAAVIYAHEIKARTIRAETIYVHKLKLN
jgi:hypothetical protein